MFHKNEIPNIIHDNSDDSKYNTKYRDDINQELFFREAVMRLCGNLEINVAIQECFSFIKNYMPIVQLSFGRTRIAGGTTELIASCSDLGITNINQTVIHSFEQEKIFSKVNYAELYKESGIYIGSKDHPLAVFFRTINLNGYNVPFFFLRLSYKKNVIGAAVFYCKENQHFTYAQQNLLVSLRIPLLITLDNCFHHLELQNYKDSILQDNIRLKKRLNNHNVSYIVGAQAGLKDVFVKVEQAAPLNIAIHITGETGTGKELIARTIHENSPRKNKPFIVVNCGAIPSSLIDSELFGHAKGSFTGAIQEHKGYFERAHEGTIFLDEVGELPLDLQGRLLRVLQDGSIKPVGSMKEIKSDFRLISATNQNIKTMVTEGLFREDLYFRLCELTIYVPPLRNRREDIPFLVEYFVHKFADMFGFSVPKIEALELNKLLKYNFPGNVRELENIVKSSMVFMKGNHLMFNFAPSQSQESIISQHILSYDENLIYYFQNLLQITEGKIAGKNGAASIAGMHANTLRSKLDKLGINYKHDVK